MEIQSQYEYRGRTYKAIYRDGIPEEEISGGGVHSLCFYGDKLVIVGNVKDNNWTPPGGAIEKGETYGEAALREIKEESNMKVIWSELIGYIDVEVVGMSLKERQYRMVCMVEPYGDFEADPDKDIFTIKLINPSDYKEYIKWGEIGDHLMKKALDMKENYLNSTK